MYHYKLVLIGYIELLEQFESIFSKDGYLISPTFGDNFCFEISGESIYYALCDIENKSSISMLHYKQKVVDAIKKRIEVCGGRLLHASLDQSGERDTQLRASNSAIRTLAIAGKDGLEIYDTLCTLINYHFQYFFNWKDGIWFCHDTSEKNGKKPRTHLQTSAVGKDRRNTLTLNTHLDSLSTLLLIKKLCPNIKLSFSIDEYIKKGIQSINQLFSIGDNYPSIVFQKADSFVMKRVSFKNMNFLENMWARIIHPVLFKLMTPTVFFKNGFIARDLAVMNVHMDYLVVNIVDFARFMFLYRDICPKGNLNYELLLQRIIKAVELIEGSKNIKDYISSSELLEAWNAEMFFTLSNLDPRFLTKARELAVSQVYCTYSPFYNNIFDEN